uniref:Uncharacterized protein n=1 Tax=Rhodococcus sp. NS1 TaxID=402236 RepID=A0A097SQC3_9NOCA|nr:hypothetical protein LRS1606.292 [Rhodococcus sp. NS1]
MSTLGRCGGVASIRSRWALIHSVVPMVADAVLTGPVNSIVMSPRAWAFRTWRSRTYHLSTVTHLTLMGGSGTCNNVTCGAPFHGGSTTRRPAALCKPDAFRGGIRSSVSTRTGPERLLPSTPTPPVPALRYP